VTLKRFVLLAALTALVPACAPVSQLPRIGNADVSAESETMRRLVVEQHLADVERLHRIVYPILAANASLCDTRVAYAAGLDDRLSIIAVAPNSPAAKAGMARGDRLVAVGGTALAPTHSARDEMAKLLADTGPVATFTLDRATSSGERARRDVTVAREPICDMQSRVMVSEIINAYATGSELVATTGLLRFLPDDSEFAVIVGHEIAHNIQGHSATGVGNPRIATLMDFFNSVWSAKPKEGSGAQTPISQAYEAEADYVGLYLIARAGFPPAAAQNVYRRFAISTPSSIVARPDSSHPATPTRVVLLGEAAREIDAKRMAGLPLIPERK